MARSQVSSAVVAGAVPGGGTAAPVPPARQARLRVVAPDGDRARVEQLYRSLGPVIYRRSLHLLKDREQARDVTQEVFIKLLRERSEGGGPEVEVAWAFRVTTNHCLNLLREGARTGTEPIDLHVEACSSAGSEVPLALHLARTILARFDAVTQAVAIGVLVQGMEHAEVAAELGISRRTVCRRVEHFLLNARKFVARSAF